MPSNNVTNVFPVKHVVLNTHDSPVHAIGTTELTPADNLVIFLLILLASSSVNIIFSYNEWSTFNLDRYSLLDILSLFIVIPLVPTTIGIISEFILPVVDNSSILFLIRSSKGSFTSFFCSLNFLLNSNTLCISLIF